MQLDAAPDDVYTVLKDPSKRFVLISAADSSTDDSAGPWPRTFVRPISRDVRQSVVLAIACKAVGALSTASLLMPLVEGASERLHASL